MANIDHDLESVGQYQNNRENSDINQAIRRQSAKRDGFLKRALRGIVLAREFLANPLTTTTEILEKWSYESMFENDTEKMVYEIYGELGLEFYRKYQLKPSEATEKWIDYKVRVEKQQSHNSENTTVNVNGEREKVKQIIGLYGVEGEWFYSIYGKAPWEDIVGWEQFVRDHFVKGQDDANDTI